jgi:hypothetical protein
MASLVGFHSGHGARSQRWKRVLAVLMLAGTLFNGLAATVVLVPVADTTLSERYPENNFGAMTFFNSGTTQNSNYNRGLLRFDIASALPSAAKIQNATLTLEVTGEPNEEFPSARFNLHRLLVPWGEGNKTNPPFGGLGQGSPATADEATWTHRFAFSPNTWTQPGATAPGDFVSASSAGVTVGGVDQSPYTILNTVALVADLQAWLDHPTTNHGWALLCQQETTKFTARRFASREDPENAPKLAINYLIAPQIQQIQKNGSQVSLHFLARAEQNYEIQFRNSLTDGDWQSLTGVGPFPQDTQIEVVDNPPTPQRFYQIRTW